MLYTQLVGCPGRKSPFPIQGALYSGVGGTNYNDGQFNWDKAMRIITLGLFAKYA